MKMLLPCFLSILIAGCSKQAERSEETSREPAQEDYDEGLTFEQWEEEVKRRNHVFAERERVRNLPPFENALNPMGDRSVTRAFIAEKKDDGIVSVIEAVAGRAPSDPHAYIPDSKPPGSYFVGSLMPRKGYSIHMYDRNEERFCFEVIYKNRYLIGMGDTSLTLMDEIRQKIREANKPAHGNP